MKLQKLVVLFPLVFMFIGIAFLFISEREFDQRLVRDNATLREDLKQAGMPREQLAAIVSAQAKTELNAYSFTQMTTFIVFIIAVFMAIPLYARIPEHSRKKQAPVSAE